MADVVIVSSEGEAPAAPVEEVAEVVQAEAVAVEAVAEAAVEVAEIEAERDIALAEISAEAQVESAEALADLPDERVDECLRSLEAMQVRVETLEASLTPPPLIVVEEEPLNPNSPESGEVDPPEVEALPPEPEKSSRARKLRWI